MSGPIPADHDGFATGSMEHDYPVLLRLGHVQLGRWGQAIAGWEADLWRADIRACCRADRIKVRTFFSSRLGVAVAYRPPPWEPPEDVQEAMRESVRKAFRRFDS